MPSGSWKNCLARRCTGASSSWAGPQIITRYSNLTDVVWNNQSKVILNNRIVP